MGKQTFRITFFVKKSRTGKNGLAPILARITINGAAREININCFAYPAKWDQAKERAKGKDRLSNEINAYLDDFHSKVIEALNDLHKEGFEGNANEVIDRLKGERSTAKMFLSEFAEYCQKRQKEAVNLLCCLKNFILYCERNEWIEKDPFQHSKMKMEQNNASHRRTNVQIGIKRLKITLL